LAIDVDTSLAEREAMLAKADFVFHLAGVNRPLDVTEFETGNCGSLEEVCSLLDQVPRAVPVMLSSSIQALLENPYGISKRRAEEFLTSWAEKRGVAAYIYRFPNLFGKWVRPDYNSAIATFCHRIALGQKYTVNDRSTVLNLNYIDDVIQSLCALPGLAMPSGQGHFHQVEPVFQKNLGEIVDLLESFKADRQKCYAPAVADPFTKRLYSTYLSYVPIDDLAVPVEKKIDDRGWLFELIKSPQFGQIFVSTTKPGITRGNHYHHTKVERFCLIQGSGLICLRNIDKQEIMEIPINDQDIRVVDIPPGYTHSITNTGTAEMIVLFWANEIFNSERPDTTFLKVAQ
jgi:UDP-2-acetamido-2,6-beta-L-arabino-hexul-4-ose reductase